MNLFLFIAAVFIITLLAGQLLEKIRVPWIFAALLVGTVLAVYNPFTDITTSPTFETLARLGMYFLLFLVGFELNLNQLRQKRGFIIRSVFCIIALEGLLGSLVVHFVFDYGWLVSALVALSFATVGEAILVPILHEFKLINTSLGQAIIGIGTGDDLIEILLLLVATILVGAGSGGNVLLIIGSLGMLILLTLGFALFRKEAKQFKFASIETLFLFVLFIFFVFIGVGEYGEAAPLAAILAGVSVRYSVPRQRLEFIDNEIKSLAYGLFAPLFFVWIGASMNVEYLFSFPLLILLVVAVSKGAKLMGSYITGRKELGKHGAILLGIGLSVRFSTSIIIVKFLFDNGVIGQDIYSVIIASSIVFKFIVPTLFSFLSSRWSGEPALQG
jgi:Kef-type K+ transport system membrane component KefB